MAGKSIEAPGTAWSEELTTDAIHHQVRSLWSPTLIELLYSQVKEQVQAEERRQTLLVGKANSLLGASGLTGTLAFTYGGFLVKEGVTGWPLVSYVIALALGIASSICAVLAVRIRDSAALSSASIFNREAILAADAADVPKPPETHGTRIQASSEGTVAYKRFLITPLWKVYAANSARHEQAAKWIWRGQRLYVAFLAAILGAGLVLASAAKTPGKKGTKEPLPSSVQSGPGAPEPVAPNPVMPRSDLPSAPLPGPALAAPLAPPVAPNSALPGTALPSPVVPSVTSNANAGP